MLFAFKVNNDVSNAIKDFSKRLIDEGHILGIVTNFKNEKTLSYHYAITNDTNEIDRSIPIAPVMPNQGAKILSDLTKKGGYTKKIAAILRPCEVRAARELSKINQVDLKSFLIISFDCPGVYSFKNFLKESHTLEEEFFKNSNAFSIQNPRSLCSICEDLTGRLADVEVKYFGLDSVYFIAHSDEAKALFKQLGVGEEIDESLINSELLENRLRGMKESKKNFLESFSQFIGSPDSLLSVLSNCINCHNCRSVCPICYCRECFFDSTAFRVSPNLFIERAKRKGGLRFLPDTTLFHLGRMNHMSFSCVGCGMCEDACPMNIPVGRIFSLVSERVRAIFNYKPGENLDEPQPVLTFKTEELEEFEIPYLESL